MDRAFVLVLLQWHPGNFFPMPQLFVSPCFDSDSDLDSEPEPEPEPDFWGWQVADITQTPDSLSTRLYCNCWLIGFGQKPDRTLSPCAYPLPLTIPIPFAFHLAYEFRKAATEEGSRV